ncbi:MAG: hypothetical protein JNJ89_03685 [Rubrivivax sp.]|nr:hypothetical protein [Rubrivivax sp.]
MKAQVPVKHLPTRMAVDNRLTTIYSTHVLIPKLGPIATQRYARQFARLLKDLAVAVELVQAAKAYQAKYKQPVAIPAPPPPAQRKDLRFKHPLLPGSAYQTYYLAGLAAFAGARPEVLMRGVSKSLLTANLREASPAPAGAPPRGGAKTSAAAAKKGGAAKAAVTVPGANVNPLPPESNDLGKVQFTATGLWPTAVSKQLRDHPQLEVAPDGRLIVQPLGPRTYLANVQMRETVRQWAKTGAKPVPADTVRNEVDESTRGYELAQILHGLAQPNAVIEDLLAAGALAASGPWLGKTLGLTNDVPSAVADILTERGTVPPARRDAIGPLVQQALAQLLQALGPQGNAFLQRLLQPQAKALRDRLFGYVIGRVDRLGGIDPGLTPLPDDTVIVGSREWAFRRTERLSVAVGTPTLRGPFAAEAVAPASELVQSESSLQEVVSFREQGSATSRSTRSEAASFTSSTFRQALAHMAEEGINSEGAFSQQTTLFDTLRERRREAIDRTLTQVSRSNEQRSGSVSRSVTSQARSYTTRGKDVVHATTEVSFQVAAPVEVEVRLEDVGLVWCPRLPSPFIALHRLVTEHEREARTDYLRQNQVTDPVRPPGDFEGATFKKEVSVRGNTRTQVVSFDIEIPAQYRDWDFDAAACTVDFRNGTSADYNWDEQWNLDDLENWHVFFRSIQRGAFNVTGSVVFETTDPELLNRGFIVITVAMERLTEAARAAIANYEAERQEAAAQRQAVEVRANQYARLRRDELIEQYEGSIELQEEAFSVLTRTVFTGGGAAHVSYWREILRSCIDWSSAGMRFEPADMRAMAYTHLPPSHFMNAQGIRFILPVHRSAEGAFFDALQGGAGTYFQQAATKVREFVGGYREIVEEAKRDEPAKLVLDAYSSELVLGRHLEAVLSEHPFAEPN